MGTFASMLKKVVSNHPHGRTVRKIIMLKKRKNYETCVRELKKHGIIPYRQVKSINMLCFYIQGGDSAVRQLRKHPHVHIIETDAIKKKLSTPKKCRVYNKVPWGVKRIHAPAVWGCTRGDGVKVAILDTGISPHPDLVIAGGVNVAKKNKSFYDFDDHGTSVAGVVAAIGKNRMIFGVAPRVKLYAVKASVKGEFPFSAIVEGIDWCIRNRMDVINMSFGGVSSGAERAIVRRAYRKGIVMVAAAGNDGPNNKNGIDFPAGFPEVIAVAATNKRNQIASFSSRGRGIDVAAPGVDILSTTNKGGFAKSNGTSLAAPFVTGTVALMLANNPKLSPRRVRKVLMKTAKFLKGFKRISQGAGLIRTNLAVSDCHVTQNSSRLKRM